MWDWITKTDSRLNLEIQHQSRLLASLLVVLGITTSLIVTAAEVLLRSDATSEQRGKYVGYAIWLLLVIGIFFINRAGKVHLAIMLTIVITIILVFAVSIPRANPTDYFLLYYLIMPIVFSSVIQRLRYTLALIVLTLAGLLLFPLVAPQVSLFQILVDPFMFVLITSVIMVVTMGYRKGLEKERQRELRHREERFRRLIQNSSDVVAILNEDGSVNFVSPTVTPILGYQPEQLVGTSAFEHVHPADVAQVKKVFDHSISQPGINSNLELRYKHNLQNRWVNMGAIGVFLPQVPGINGLLVNLRDITSQKQAEQLLVAEKERLAVTLASIGDGVIATDYAGRVTLLNLAAEKLTGWKQLEAVNLPLSLVFRTVDEATNLPEPDRAAQVLKHGRLAGSATNTTLISRDGSRYLIADTAAPITHDGEVTGLVLVFRDITARHQLELEAQKTQKLESLGILAGGIAHDFNNILAAMVGNVGLARMELENNPIIEELLSEVEAAAFNATGLTRQLLTFAKGGAPIKKVAELTPLLTTNVTFALRGSPVRPEFSVPVDLWLVDMDAGQIGQVINNLTINAEQASPQGGTLFVKAENVPAATAKLVAGLEERDYVCFSLHDEGYGIAREHLDKIFDPYFTTKPQGSGMGLASAFSILNRHQGLIRVTSEPGQGSTFYVYLPAVPQAVADPIPALDLLPAFTSGKERQMGRVLVLDDEKPIQSLLKKALEHAGCTVDVSGDGAAIVEMYRSALLTDSPYDLLILDLTVPGGMGGKAAMAELRMLNPAVKAIVSSGYSNDPVVANYREFGFSAALVKPFKLEELVEKVATIIHAPSRH